MTHVLKLLDRLLDLPVLTIVDDNQLHSIFFHNLQLTNFPNIGMRTRNWEELSYMSNVQHRHIERFQWNTSKDDSWANQFQG